MRSLAVALLLVLLLPFVAIAQDESYHPDPNYEERRLKFCLGLGTQRSLFGGMEWQIPFARSSPYRIAFFASGGFDPFKVAFVPAAGLAFYSKPDDYFRKWGWTISSTASFHRWTSGEEHIRSLIFSLTPGLLIRHWSKTWVLSVGPSIESRTTRLETSDYTEDRTTTRLGAVAELKLVFW